MKTFESALSSFKSNHSKGLNEKPSIFFFYQLEVNNGEIKSLFLDKNVSLVTGYSKQELTTVGFNDLKIFDSRYHFFVQDTLLEASKEPQHFEFDSVIIHKNGNIILVKNKCVSFLNPITQLREIMGITELTTELNIESYSKTAISKIINIAYNFGLVGTFYYDIKSHNMVWSEEVKRMHGYDSEPPVDDFLKFVTAKHYTDAKVIIRLILDSKEGFQSLYKFHRIVDNTYRNILSIMFPIFDRNKNLIGVSGNVIDLFDDSISITPNNNSEQIKKVHPEKDSIFIKHHNQYIKINYKEILAISSLRDYVQIFTTNRVAPYTYYTKLYKIKESLPEDIFIQIHRSHIVNIKHVQKFVENNVIINDMKFPISRNYKAQIMDLLK